VYILAEKLLGKDSTVILVEGHREMEIFADRGSTRWVSFDQLKGLDDIYSLIHTVSGKSDLHSMVRLIWNAIEKGKEDGNRKVLVFVPSRALCDKFSLVLSVVIKKRRDLFVGTHHGSLDRALREKAEQKFMASRDAVLVATTTLEVGIDIGDVDIVALIGAPPNTSSLLQRIGRSGRRNGCVRVLPIAKSRIEARAFSSMLEAGFRGALDPTPNARLWSVFVQQALSHTAQAGKDGRPREDLLQLAQETWPESAGPRTASRILDYLIEQEMLEERRNRFYLGSIWSDRLERSGGDLHHNFDSETLGIPVIDASTGEVLTHVAQTPIGPKGIALAGQRWDIVSDSGEIIVKSSRAEEGGKTFRYAARSAPTTMSFAEHVRRGLGFEDNETPIVDLGGRTLWFHFAGSAYESVLTSLFPDLKSVRELNGLAVRGSISEKNLKTLAANRPSLVANLQKAADGLVSSLSLGRFHSDLPQDVRTSVAVEFFGPDKFFEWLSSRKVTLMNEKDETYRKLMNDLN
jgi:ATP-dependent Lhr-like helicase